VRTSTNNPLGRYSVGDVDLHQAATISPIWELPFGSGGRFLNTKGLANALAGGWEFTGILTFHSSNPYTVYSPEDYSNSGSASPQPERTCNGAGPKTIEEWFDTSCFTTAPLALALASGAPRLGNSGHNILFGPGLNQWDTSLIKRNRTSRRFSLEFRAELFNLFNHPRFGIPASTTGTGDFGLIESAGTPRDIQFGLKLEF
jgi:hypothetical protein